MEVPHNLQMFSYDPFQNSNSIRIFVLDPGKGDSPLMGKLMEVPMDDCPSFTALSYVWGSVTWCRQLTCDGKLLRITESLDDALRGVRQHTGSLRLWADQLCINQDDLKERSQQVQFMGQIYGRAQLVHVWLGPDINHSSERAFRLLNYLRESFDIPSFLPRFTDAQNKNLEQFDNEDFRALKELYDLPWVSLNHDFKSTIMGMLINVAPQFSRVWICQEIGTAIPGILQWGHVRISWDTLYQVSKVMDEKHRRLRLHMGMKVQRITYLHRRFIDEGGPANPRRSFACELSRGAHNLNATDPRDHVFAKLGHYSARSRRTGMPIIEADYTKPVAEIYLAVATELLKERISLEALNTIYMTCSPADDLPSWVPRWDVRAPSWVLGDNKSVFAATKCEPIVEFVDPRSVNIAGIEIDTVDYCSRMLPTTNGECKWYGNKTALERERIKDLWFRLTGLPDIDTSALYINGEFAITAFCQALSAGCFYLAMKRYRYEGDYHSTPSTKWLSHGASYLLDILGDTTAAVDNVRQMSAGGDGGIWTDGANSVTDCRRIFRTAKGYYGLGPPLIENGDIVCVLYGGKTPFCLRPADCHYGLVGECFVFGLMNNEAIDMMEKGKLKQKIFGIE